MNKYRYILEPYGNGRGTRYSCPYCGKSRQFTRYIDTESASHVHETVGICNRQSKCGYHYTPKQYLADSPWLQQDQQAVAMNQKLSCNAATGPLPQVQQRMSNALQHGNKISSLSGYSEKAPTSYIPMEILKESRRCYGENNFILFLRRKLGYEATEKLISLYHIGTSDKWPGSTVFWQIDQHGKVRAGKIMLYNKVTGKRVKKPFPHLTWMHKDLGLETYNLQQCLFGEYLLIQFPDKPVAVVESEKTAIICSFYLPEYIWLASGGINNLSYEKCLPLRTREVTFFPDLGSYEVWKNKALDHYIDTTFKVSDILERIADENQRIEGLDLADFFILTNFKFS